MPGRLTSCLSSSSQARAKGKRGARLSREAEALSQVNAHLEHCTLLSRPPHDSQTLDHR